MRTKIDGKPIGESWHDLGTWGEIRSNARAMIAQGKTAYRFWRELHEQGIKTYSLCDTMEPFSVRAMMDLWLSYTLRGARILHTGNPTVK